VSRWGRNVTGADPSPDPESTAPDQGAVDEVESVDGLEKASSFNGVEAPIDGLNSHIKGAKTDMETMEPSEGVIDEPDWLENDAYACRVRRARAGLARAREDGEDNPLDDAAGLTARAAAGVPLPLLPHHGEPLSPGWREAWIDAALQLRGRGIANGAEFMAVTGLSRGQAYSIFNSSTERLERPLDVQAVQRLRGEMGVQVQAVANTAAKMAQDPTLSAQARASYSKILMDATARRLEALGLNKIKVEIEGEVRHKVETAHDVTLRLGLDESAIRAIAERAADQLTTVQREVLTIEAETVG